MRVVYCVVWKCRSYDGDTLSKNYVIYRPIETNRNISNQFKYQMDLFQSYVFHRISKYFPDQRSTTKQHRSIYIYRLYIYNRSFQHMHTAHSAASYYYRLNTTNVCGSVLAHSLNTRAHILYMHTQTLTHAVSLVCRNFKIQNRINLYRLNVNHTAHAAHFTQPNVNFIFLTNTNQQ